MLNELQDRIKQSAQRREKLQIQGAGSKQAFLPPPSNTIIDIKSHTGIIDYQPNELVIRARAGTALAEIESTLAECRQMLACEPPNIDGRSTLGGALACGWSGPRRPWAGAVRDHVLGVTMLNGRGELLRFGGSVIKNVAGFDVSRLMVGSMGTLGIITEANLKVSPKPEVDIVVSLACGQAEGIRRANQASAAPIPLSGAAWEDDVLRLRLSGNAAAVATGRTYLGGEIDEDGLAWFETLRHLRHPLFTAQPAGMMLWRLSLPPAAPPILVGYPQLLDWGGGQRWLWAHGDAAEVIQAAALGAGGYASCRRTQTVWPKPMQQAPAIAALNRQIKLAFDPMSVFGDSAPPFA